MRATQLEKKMDVTSVCGPLIAGSDSPNNTTSAPNAASVTDADKTIKAKIDSTQVEGDKSDDAFLKGLLADDYCHVCEAVLLFESQRLSHYEGKKHAQKLKVYLQAKRAEKTNPQSAGSQRTMTIDKDRFCELCKMVFSSQVVAQSHYEGKVHTKNLRKQGLQPPDPYEADQKHAPVGGREHYVDPAASSTALNTEVDFKDPNKFCALCTASFNNPHMALQHYSGRKHQRNQARQELIKELGDDAHQASSLMCQMCSVQFNSVEMYQAHMQGNKHQVREKKVVDLCKSQQRVYSTFADELADYIQVQKARGITPKANHVSLQGEKADEEDLEEEQQRFNTGDVTRLHEPLPNLPSKSQPHYQSQPGSYYPVEAWTSRYEGPSWPSHRSATNVPPSVLSPSRPPQLPGRTIKRKRQRKQSSSSSYTSSSYSSYSSSYSSSTSDTDDSENQRRGSRKIRKSRKHRCKKMRDEVQMRRKEHRKEGENHSQTKGEECGESDQERRRKKLKHHSKQGEEKQSWEEDCEVEREEKETDSLQPEEMKDSKQTEEHLQTEILVEQENDGQNESAKSKSRKEKKKTKVAKADTRTEEEKLWDDSILGC